MRSVPIFGRSRSSGPSSVSHGSVPPDSDLRSRVESEIRRTELVIRVAVVFMAAEMVLYAFALWRLFV